MLKKLKGADLSIFIRIMQRKNKKTKKGKGKRHHKTVMISRVLCACRDVAFKHTHTNGRNVAPLLHMSQTTDIHDRWTVVVVMVRSSERDSADVICCSDERLSGGR